MSKSNLLITGGCGFIGSNFINYIFDKTDYNIINLDAMYYCASENNVKEEIRNNLIVNEPDNRGIFTTSQCELIAGVPFEESDQDTIEDLLTLSEGELKFWDKVGVDCNYIYDLAEEGWENYIK